MNEPDATHGLGRREFLAASIATSLAAALPADIAVVMLEFR